MSNTTTSEFDKTLDFIFHVGVGDAILQIDTASGETREVSGSIEDGDVSEYTTISTDEYEYRIWNGAGINGRSTGDVTIKTETDQHMKIGEFKQVAVTK